MISKQSVNAYLKKPRDNHNVWKKYSRRKLIRLKDRLPYRPPIWKKLRTHQRIGFLIGVTLFRFAFWYDTGTGKTLLCIAIARYLKRAGICKHFLILVPNKINCYEWVRQVNEHSPRSEIVVLKGSSDQKWETLVESDSLFTVTTYAGLYRMACETVINKKGKPNLKPVKKLVDRLARKFDGLIMDESTEVGGHRTLGYRICRRISKSANAVFALSGTPFGRDPTPLWAQMFLIDFGETLGPTLGLFRAAFFSEKKNYWSGFPEYTFKKKMSEKLHRFIAHRSLRYDADAADVPKVIPIKKYVELQDDAQVYYEKAKEKLIASHGNYKEMKNSFLRMRQISSGFIGYYDDEVGQKAKFVFDENPKLDALLDLVTYINPKHKILIFHDFIHSGHLIAKELKKAKIKFSRIFSGTKDPEAELDRFINDPDCQVFLINNDAGAYNLNLQVAKYVIYYESPVRPIIRKQTQARAERYGSLHNKIYVYDLIVKGTMDEKILEFIAEGRNLLKRVMSGKASV